MLSMFGGCKTGYGGDNKVPLSGDDSDFLSDRLSLIYGHPESFTTEKGKNILEMNEEKIFVFITDEVGSNIWSPDFRPLMSNIPGSIRVFTAVSAPMLVMSATVGKAEQQKVLEDTGMKNRKFEIIELNPVLPHVFREADKNILRGGVCQIGILRPLNAYPPHFSATSTIPPPFFSNNH